MFRLYDWQCCACGKVDEHLTSCPAGERPKRKATQLCRWCGDVTPHERLMSCPAPYMGERVCNPMVRGGAFDTMGHAPVPDLPDLPAGVESNTANYRQLWSTPEWREAKADLKEANRKNAEKRKRASAMARGENINMRNDRCAGDPKVMS